eukprot:5497184-Alexandrium_andersonii.AAC.1
MRAQARAVADRAVGANLVAPAADPVAPVTPEDVQAVRRNAPVHTRDPDVPGHALRGWRFPPVSSTQHDR